MTMRVWSSLAGAKGSGVGVTVGVVVAVGEAVCVGEGARVGRGVEVGWGVEIGPHPASTALASKTQMAMQGGFLFIPLHSSACTCTAAPAPPPARRSRWARWWAGPRLRAPGPCLGVGFGRCGRGQSCFVPSGRIASLSDLPCWRFRYDACSLCSKLIKEVVVHFIDSD
jgi:hypothetical protein